jgi:tRNA (cmo5U34)-methyltransferase
MPYEAFNFETDFAKYYDNLARKAFFGYEALFSMMLALLTTSLPDTANVLVVGSGSGAELMAFGSRMPKWKLTGVEPSEQMIRLSQSKLESQNLAERVKLFHGYIGDLPEHEKFDAATLSLVLHFVPDNGSKRLLLQNIANRLKPEAGFVLVDLGGDPESEEFHHLMAGWKNYMVEMGLASEAVESLTRQASKSQFFVHESRIRELLKETGFKDVERFYSAFLASGWIARLG